MTNPSIFLEGFLECSKLCAMRAKREENMKDLTVGKTI